MAEQKTADRGNRQRETRVVVENRQARFHYEIEDTLEAGIMLMGWEVKAILGGQATFNSGSAFIRFQDGDAFLESLTVTPLSNANKGLLEELAPSRQRKLLLRKQELRKLEKRVAERGYTVVPLAITYNGKLKVEIGVAKGKKQADKREALKERDLDRSMRRELKALQ